MTERDTYHRGPPLPTELAAAIRDHAYACLTTRTEHGTVFVVKAPGAEIERLRGRFPIHVRHELYQHPQAPVIRLRLRLYDDLRAPLAMESFINVRDPDQRADYAGFAEQAQLYLLFYDEHHRHRLNKGLANDQRAIIPEVLAAAEQLAAAIPAAQYDFDAAKQAVQGRTRL